jgi:hypothetical protein
MQASANSAPPDLNVSLENIVKFSFWSQQWNYKDTVKGVASEIIDELMEYYRTSSSTFKLINKNNNSFKFSRGRKLVSAFGLGSEKWCYHIIKIDLKENDGLTEINWDIDLKLFGVQAANNSLIKECDELITKKSLG